MGWRRLPRRASAATRRAARNVVPYHAKLRRPGVSSKAMVVKTCSATRRAPTPKSCQTRCRGSVTTPTWKLPHELACGRKSRRRVSVRGRVFRAVDRVGFGRYGRNAGVVGKSNIVQVIAGYRDINVTMGPVRSQLISGLSVGGAKGSAGTTARRGRGVEARREFGQRQRHQCWCGTTARACSAAASSSLTPSAVVVACERAR